MKTTLVGCMTMVAIAFWVSSAAANSIDVGFGDSSGVQLTILDNTQAGGPNQVLFSFTNGGGKGSVEGIYIQDSSLFSSIDSLYESGGVNFVADKGGPNMPGGNPVGFSAGYVARADNAQDGLGQGEYLGIVFNLNSNVTLATILEKLNSKETVVGVFDPQNPYIPGSTYTNDTPQGTNPVPEPTSLVLFGLGSAGLAGLRKRRNRK